MQACLYNVSEESSWAHSESQRSGTTVNRRRLIELLFAPVVARKLGNAAKQDRVVIVGAGIIGASIAYHLVERGANVTVLEKIQPGSGATRNSFAWLNATFSKQPRSYYELNLAGIAGWRRLSLQFRDLRVQWGGSVQWYEPGANATRLHDNIAQRQAWGYSVRAIQAGEIPVLLPAIAPGPVGAACFADQEATVDPLHALTIFLEHAKAGGARLEYPVEVTGIVTSNGRVTAVESTGAKYPCDFLVLAAGVDSERLARLVNVNVPLKDSPGALAHSAPHERLLDRVALAPGANIKQNPDGRIVTGTDFGGTPVKDVSHEFGLALLKNAERFLPKLSDASLETVTLGHRVLPKDDLPIVGFAQECPNLYVAAMHSGMTLSPIVGQIAATEILDGARVDLLAPYRPSRFA
jgi:glycine/D-amino acid oxidase-like deaminating enzyme